MMDHDIREAVLHLDPLRSVVKTELIQRDGTCIVKHIPGDALVADDVDLLDRYVRVYGKGSKERMIQLENAEVLSTLGTYKELEPSQSGEPFFKNRLAHPLSDQSVRHIVCKYADKAGCGMHITPHMFRHSFATLLLEADVDIRYIQKFLGHSSISTTQIYTFVAAAKQRDILASRHPRNKFSFE